MAVIDRGNFRATERIGPFGRLLLAVVGLLVVISAAVPPPAGAQDNAVVPVDDYIRRAFENNPSLAAMRERIRMKENAALRAGALDDPRLRLGVTNIPVDSWSFRDEDMTGKEVELSQMFPFPGKRGLRTEAATREKEQTEFDLQEMRNMLRAEVKMGYAELAAVRRQMAAVRQSQDVLGDLVRSTGEMYAVGRAGQADVLRGQVEFGKMRDMLIGLENRERVLSVRLNTLAALPPGEPVPPLEELEEFTLPRTQGQLMALYEEERPSRKAAQARIRKGDADIGLARKEYYPDFEVSASYMQRDAMPDGTSRPDMFSSMVMMNLPIWRRGKLDPALREMEAEREMARRELENLDLEASNAIGASLASLASKASLAALYRTTLLPQAEQSFLANVAAYRVGKVDFPMLMDSVMAVLTFRREHAMIVGDLHMEKARLEAAVGAELEGERPDDGSGPGPGG